MAAHQAPPSLGFSRQEHWSGLPFPSPDESEPWGAAMRQWEPALLTLTSFATARPKLNVSSLPREPCLLPSALGNQAFMPNFRHVSLLPRNQSQRRVKGTGGCAFPLAYLPRGSQFGIIPKTGRKQACSVSAFPTITSWPQHSWKLVRNGAHGPLIVCKSWQGFGEPRPISGLN